MGKLYALSDLHISHKVNLEEFVQFFTALPSVNQRDNGVAGTDYEDEYYDSLVIDLSEPITYSQLSRPAYNFTEDGLILAGDLGERLEHLRVCFGLAVRKFKSVWWVPGNHELYTLPGEPRFMTMKERFGGEDKVMSSTEKEAAQRDARLNTVLRGEAKYLECCRVASEYGVLTPEDEFIRWEYDVGEMRAGTFTKQKTEAVVVCPIFTLYDYSFRPGYVSRENALDWAMEAGVQATDEALLHPDPYPDRDTWCQALVRKTEERLEASQSQRVPLVIINHWPLREDLVTIPLIPRFSLWCGTKLTQDWHTRFNAKVVVSGHLHVRRTDWRDDCRFEEVSLGYPRQWEQARAVGKGIGEMLREILPGKYNEDLLDKENTIWRREG